MTIVPLAGHTPGQIGVVVQEADDVVLLGGDSSYAQELMLRGVVVVDGVAPDEREARRTIDRIQAFARSTPTVYLVAHDAGTGRRLEGRHVIDGAFAERT